MWEATSTDGTVFAVHADDISSWARIEHHHDELLGDAYHAITEDGTVGVLHYLVDFPRPGFITIGSLHIEEDHRNKGVALALLARCHADHPGDKISPGIPPADGVEFISHIWTTQPEVRAAGALLHESVAALAGD